MGPRGDRAPGGGACSGSTVCHPPQGRSELRWPQLKVAPPVFPPSTKTSVRHTPAHLSDNCALHAGTVSFLPSFLPSPSFLPTVTHHKRRVAQRAVCHVSVSHMLGAAGYSKTVEHASARSALCPPFLRSFPPGLSTFVTGGTARNVTAVYSGAGDAAESRL